jgi:hypothetical protein
MQRRPHCGRPCRPVPAAQHLRQVEDTCRRAGASGTPPAALTRAPARRRRRHPRDAARRGPHALRRRRLPPPLPPPALQGRQARAAAALLRGLPARGVPRAHALRGARAVQLVRHGEPVHLRGLLRRAAARHAGAPPAAQRPRLSSAGQARSMRGLETTAALPGRAVQCALVAALPRRCRMGRSQREQRARMGTESIGAASVGLVELRTLGLPAAGCMRAGPCGGTGAPGARVDTWPARGRGGCRMHSAHGGQHLSCAKVMQLSCCRLRAGRAWHGPGAALAAVHAANCVSRRRAWAGCVAFAEPGTGRGAPWLPDTKGC